MARYTSRLLSFLFALLLVKECYAFFSAGTLILLGATLAGFLNHLLVIVIAFVISLFIHNKKTKKKHRKRVLLILIFTFLIITLGLFSYYFYRTYRLNRPMDSKTGMIEMDSALLDSVLAIDYNVSDEIKQRCLEENAKWKDIDSAGEDKVVEKSTECMIKTMAQLEFSSFINNRYIDVNHIPMDEYEKLWIFGIDYDERIALKNSIPVLDYISVITNPEELDTMLEGVEKEDRVLFYCYGGSSAQILAFLAHKKGYDSYYTYLNNINNDEIIDSDLIQEVADKNAIIILPASLREKRNNIVLYFKGSPSQFEDLEEKYGTLEIIYYINIKESMKEDFLKSNIICKNELNCLLTQHFLYSFAPEIKTIYRV